MTQESEKAVPSKKFSRTKSVLSTEIFKDTRVQVPDFLSHHPMFSQPHRLRKIFPSLGLENFEEEAAMAMPALDLKRGDNFVSFLVKAMYKGLIEADQLLKDKIDMVQFGFGVGDAKVIDDMSNTQLVIAAAAKQLNMNNGVIEKVVQTTSGKIALKLFQDIVGANGKVLYKKDFPFFSLFSKFKDKFKEWEMPFFDLDNSREFKTFNTENVPNKKFSVVFSAEGKKGAWDIVTMSMRGISSCQAWPKEYPRCLVGSVVSKYIGIIYLTSGADHDGYGSKMIRRCLVRYVIDAVDRKPCILIDKMYTEEHTETIRVFTEALRKRTNLPIYYSPHLKNKARHLYVPYEELRKKVPEKEWSYQDTALKTEIDLKIHTLSNGNLEELNRRISICNGKLISGLSAEFRSAYEAGRATDAEVLRLTTVMRMDRGFDYSAGIVINDIVANFPIEHDLKIVGVAEQYKRYLMKFIGKKKEIHQTILSRLPAYFPDFPITAANKMKIADMLCGALLKSLKQELKLAFSM